MKRKPRHGLNLIERAYFAKQWQEEAVTANLHALIGGDPKVMVNTAGRVLFIVMGASVRQGLDLDLPEIRIMRGAIGAAHDQVGEDDIPEARRASIVSGLEAADRLMPSIARTHLIDAAIALELMLRRQDVRLSDFEALSTPRKETV